MSPLNTIKLLKLLLEGRVSDFEEKYSNIPPRIQSLIVKGDLTANKKYIDWIGKIVTTMGKVDDEPFVKDILRRCLIHMNKLSGIDIYKFNYDDFVNATNEAEKKLTNRERLASDTDLIYEDDRFLIVAPRSQEAASDFASGRTRWCIVSNEQWWVEHYSKESIVMIKDRNESRPNNLLCLTADNGTNYMGWVIYDANDHTVDRTFLSELLPEEAMEKINDFLDADEADVIIRGETMRQEAEDKWVDEYKDEALEEVCNLFINYAHIKSVSVDSIIKFLIKSLGKNEVNKLGKSIASLAYSLNGHSNGVSISKEYSQFTHEWNDFDSDSYAKLDNAFEKYLASLGNMEKMKIIILNAIGKENYITLQKQVDLNQILPSAIVGYERYINKNQVGFPEIPHGHEKIVPTNISGVVRMLMLGGEEKVANFIKSYSNQKITESRIKLTNLLT